MSFEEFVEKYKHLFNTLVIGVGAHTIYRLVGFGEDKYDFYYILLDFKGKEEWHTAVGGVVSLLPVDRYDYIDNVFQINHCPKVDVMKVESE
tara:strand:- start:308 stop:583 length:276 start_codon:yes stop_codon:yes gene_type:complete